MSRAEATVQRVRGRADRAEFLAVARWVYRDRPRWVPPLEADLARQIDPARGDFFRHSRAEFFLARRGGRAVGRIAAMRNERHLAAHADGVGFFGFFECEDDAGTAAALLRAAEGWLRAEGLVSALGPANFSIQDEAGVLTEGFDLSPMTGMAYSPPYYAALLEATGYGAAKDLWVYRLRREDWRPEQGERIQRLAERVAPDVTVRCLRLAEMPAEAARLASVFAEAWRDNWGAQPITEAEFLAYGREYRRFIDPRLILFAERGGECLGIAVAMPNMNEAVAAGGGRLLPWGWWRLLRGRARARSARVFLLGIRPSARRLGLPARFLGALRDVLERSRIDELEFSWVLPENVELVAMLERFGVRRVQVLRLYRKNLGD